MSKKKILYFKSIDDTFCEPLNSHLDDAMHEGLDTITLIEAIPDNHNPDYIWCTHEGEVVEREQCKKSICPFYQSKSGRGLCKNRGNLYQHGKEVKFKVPKKKNYD